MASLDEVAYADVLAGGTVHRTAFPAYRVFIYGQEITNDVLSVRVNQSGGSAERTPGSCAITLNNHEDRYIITHQDLIAIGQSIANYNKYIDGTIKKSEYNNIDEFQHLNQDLWDAISSGVSDENLGVDSFSSEVQKELMNLREQEENKLAVAYDAETPWGSIKRSVITEKLGYRSKVNPTNSESELVKYPGGIIHDYPFQEGDCVFHSNDPVRVVFRDPFDARRWYWMFTGFVTSYTEDSDVNKSSNVTITCTDVTKMARYSLIQLSTGLADPNIEDVLREELNTVSSTGVIPFQEIFEGFTIFEILETIFFGSQSAEKVINETVMREIANMDADARLNYLTNIMNISPNELEKILPGPDVRAETLTETGENVIRKHKQAGRIERLDKLNMAAVTSSRNVGFKRRSDAIGLHYIYFQYDGAEASTGDKALGSGIEDLNKWNEIIHHRVREIDLTDMLDRDEDIPTELLTSGMPKIEDIITVIGTNLDKYPVGGGKVYYFAPATLDTNLGDVLDRGMGTISSIHSHFRDRLSYIYDLAQRIDFRFYATPKGDVIFEMPFFDFDPGEFVGKYGIADSYVDDVNKSFNNSYNDIFAKSYDGEYSDVDKLTSMVFETTKLDADLELYNYEKKAEFNYEREFTVEEHEQLGFSNTSTDEGVLTVYRAQPNYFKNQTALNNLETRYQISSIKELIPILGVRVMDGNVWGILEGDRAAQFFCALELNRVNAEARNTSIPVVPMFGLMVNRPIFWRKRNYYANIVNLQHSIVWNSNVDTTINVNQIRGWGGRLDDRGRPIHAHFGNGNRPYNLAELLKQTKVETNKKK